MRLTSCSACTAKGPRPSHLNFNNSFYEHIFPSFFFKYFVRKNCRGGGESLLKWNNKWLRLLNVLFLGRIYIARGPWHLGDSCNIFLSNVSEDQKKSYYLSAGPWHCSIWQIRPWQLHYVYKKFR